MCYLLGEACLTNSTYDENIAPDWLIFCVIYYLFYFILWLLLIS